MSTVSSAPVEPLLRTLSPALRRLEANLYAWLDGPHPYPLSTKTRSTLDSLAADLRRQAGALDVDRPLLVIMLMGGTGVGKSTLLNALAGGAIAQASYMRPTTRDPVVYYHDSIRPERLDPAFQHCRLSVHQRPGLEQKVIVDTPDLDSNDLANREKLHQLLPVADVVLYVGSQEKYHDKLGWELFLQQRRRRAFAFVLNKWDRCVRGNGGLRPDEDLRRDLRAEGFEDPLLFRTCAQLWADRGQQGMPAVPQLPEGEQFEDLVRWLEMGLNRLEIEAIKTRGVSQLLQHLHERLVWAYPPDLASAASKVRLSWENILAEEAAAASEVLLNTLEPYQAEIEHHFALERHRRFHGIMAFYLRMFTRAKYLGSTLRNRIPLLSRAAQTPETPAAWDLTAFTRNCSGAAGERHLDARGRALPNRLLVAADHEEFPLALLTEPTERAAKENWRHRYAQMLVEVLRQVQRERSEPVGPRRWMRHGIVFLADWLPAVAFFAACARLLWLYFMGGVKPELFDVVMPFVVLLLVLMLLHLLIVFLLPQRWPAIRGEFRRRLEQRLRSELQGVYLSIPQEVAESLSLERKRIEQVAAETNELMLWLGKHEQAAGIAALYGK
jgi:hypothetical protein